MNLLDLRHYTEKRQGLLFLGKGDTLIVICRKGKGLQQDIPQLYRREDHTEGICCLGLLACIGGRTGLLPELDGDSTCVTQSWILNHVGEPELIELPELDGWNCCHQACELIPVICWSGERRYNT